MSLLAYWIGGEMALLVVSLGLQLGAVFWVSSPNVHLSLRDKKTRLMPQFRFEREANVVLQEARQDGNKTAVFYIRIDEFDLMREHYGDAAIDAVLDQMATRIHTHLREHDLLAANGQDGFAICLAPQAAADLETCLEIAGRISRSIAEPFAVDGTSLYLTASLGFCQLGREANKDAKGIIDPVLKCAKIALDAAAATTPGAIRAYSHETQARRSTRRLEPGNDRAVTALEKGELVAWFQPQISTDTGRITGFETLARWQHPTRGTLPPSEFLPELDAAGRMGELSEIMRFHALTALDAWDKAGVDVPQVAVNFSTTELNDPQLVDRISMELDRFELAPARLAVEVLETVVAKGPSDVLTRNIGRLSALGCHVDLDDFGTGHASLASIRRFGVGRIKIDRSFVIKADRDPEQQRMIKAILTMAEKLNIETLAEGVETVGEHSLLAQLGCTHVQGFGIGRPMPFDKTIAWIHAHNNKIQPIPGLSKKFG